MVAANPLTHLESRVLSAIDQHISQHGQSPTIAELATALRLKSKGTVHRYVQSLIEKGKLERHGTGWRGLRVTGKPPVDKVGDKTVEKPVDQADQSYPSSGERAAGNVANHNIIDLVNLPAERISTGDFKLPLLGKIAAGQPIEAIEDQAHLDLAEYFIGPDRYALRVSGESMIDVGILDGDTVILRKTDKVRTGDIVVALIDSQEATLKRLGLYQPAGAVKSGDVRVGQDGRAGEEGGIVELIPENKAMSTMRYSSERVSFQGVLVGQLRSY